MPTPAPIESPAPTQTMPPIAPETVQPLVPTRDVIGVRTPTAFPTISATITSTATVTPTIAPTATRPPVSTGPLDFNVALIGCRLDPAREGGVILKFRVDAVGGNGVYTYIREGQVVARESDRPATKGTAVIDAWRVQSGDGQNVERKYRFVGSEFGCP